MKKLTLVALRRDAGQIMQRLMWLGCVEVERSPVSDAVVRDTRYDSELQKALADAKMLEDASTVLIKHGNIKHGMFAPPPTVGREEFGAGMIGKKTYTEVLGIADTVIKTARERTGLETELNATRAKIDQMQPWLSYGLRLSDDHTACTRLFRGTIPAVVTPEDVETAAETMGFPLTVTEVRSDADGDINAGKNTSAGVRYVAAICLKKDEEAALGVLSGSGFVRSESGELSGLPAVECSRLYDREKELSLDMANLSERLDTLSAEFDALQIALDMANTEAGLAEAKRKLLTTDRTVILSGWIPAEHTSALEKKLKDENVYYELDDPEEGDDVPVHLVNGKPAGYFESVVEMYSLPAYGTFDPTKIMMIFFFIIFGLMLADVVYGLILTFACLFLIKKTSLSQGVKGMCSLFAVCGISCTVWGVVFGSYLGDLPVQFMKNFFGVDITVWAAFDIMTESMVFLVLSLAVGAVHMLTGMGIRFYVLFGSGQKFSAIFDEGSWFVLFGGIGVYFLNSTVGLAIALTGVAMLVLTQGRREKNPIMKLVKGVGSLYSLINYMSDLLSYSRIMALGLSSAVVASVFNLLATMGGPTVPGAIIFVLVILIGHLLNLAINLLGTFVHTSRLQYVEFFGKFFEDGGRPFRPVRPDITHSALSAEPPEDGK